MENPKPESLVMSHAEACELLHISRQTLDRWVAAGRIQRHKAGRRTLFMRADVLKLIKPDARKE